MRSIKTNLSVDVSAMLILTKIKELTGESLSSIASRCIQQATVEGFTSNGIHIQLKLGSEIKTLDDMLKARANSELIDTQDYLNEETLALLNKSEANVIKDLDEEGYETQDADEVEAALKEANETVEANESETNDEAEETETTHEGETEATQATQVKRTGFGSRRKKSSRK